MKNCIFCGNEVSEKTKEHIVPKWLMKLTGDPNRQVNLGVNYPRLLDANSKEKVVRRFSFSAFHFPACNSCNSKYSHLENKTKLIVEKILVNKSITAKELDTLMDWVDKIRIGLWLGFMQLNKNLLNLNPKFAIDRRIGSKDRMLAAYRFDDVTDGVSFYGADSFAFQHIPSCFGFRINNYYFFNISYDYIFSKKLGFPFREVTEISENYDFGGDMVQGYKKVNRKILPKPIFEGSMQFIQPIFNGKSLINPQDQFKEKNFYTSNEFVIENSLDFNDGKGAIFTSNSNGSYKSMNKNDQVINLSSLDDLSIRFEVRSWEKIFYRMVYNYQNLLLENYSFINLYNPKDRKFLKKQIKFAKDHNKRLMNH